MHNDHVKIGDFGLSKVLSADEITLTYCGTSVYMAPEILQSAYYTNKVDIWALGVVFFIMSTGYLPFADKVKDKKNDKSYIETLKDMTL